MAIIILGKPNPVLFTKQTTLSKAIKLAIKKVTYDPITKRV